MKNDPIYLSKACTLEASLGVLSVAGNVCKSTISDVNQNVNASLAKINDNALASLALLVATSAPEQKDIIIKLVMNMLVEEEGL